MGGGVPEARYKHCALTIDKKLLIVGGINQNARLGNIYEFNTESRSWSMLVINKNKGIFKGRYGHSCCLVDSGKNLLIFGGSEDEKKNDLLRFEISSGNFYRI